MKGSKVLVVEDNPANLELVCDLLELAGYQVWSAGDAMEGLQRAREGDLDLILMDIQLPEMDGLEAVRILRNDEKTNHIPVVALTAHILKREREQIAAVGCAGFISKPIDTRTFARQVGEFLNNY